MSDVTARHLTALQIQRDAAIVEVEEMAAAARASIDGELEEMRKFAQPPERPPLIADVPVDEPPPYVPPPAAPAGNALIPDTPLVDASPSNHKSLAFDDAPLWQS